MDTKNHVEIFNAMIRGTPVSFKEKLIFENSIGVKYTRRC